MVAVRMASPDAPVLLLIRSANLRTAATQTFSSGMVAASIEKVTMFKVTPNPPATDSASPYESHESKKFHEAAERALDHYLGPPTAEIMAAPYVSNRLFMVNPASANEPLLADASESLGSACVMINDLAGMLEGTHRRTLLGIAQVVMLGELAVNQVLDNLVPVD
jgi:hypothetical protein